MASATTREVRTATAATTPTVGFSGSGRQGRSSGDRHRSQYPESSGENSSTLRCHSHGVNSVAGLRGNPRGIATLNTILHKIRRFPVTVVQVPDSHPGVVPFL
jgi:hypothetical protein